MRGWSWDGLCRQNQRPSNMDNIYCGAREMEMGPSLLAVVCDGVGSTQDGAFASAYCVGHLQAWFQETREERMGLALRDRVLELNREIISAARINGLNTATTLTALLIHGETYVVIHAGDSRAYRYGDGQLTQLTTDDVSAQGRLTACVGRWEDVLVHYEEGQVDGGSFLLCSDGLYKHISEARLQLELEENASRRPKKILDKLFEVAVDQGETDNISAVLLQNKK